MDKTSCGCCAGTQVLTPDPVVNRPGLAALAYRVGTHARFLESMKARLSSLVVSIPNPDDPSQAPPFYPLHSLTTRAPDDPALALLDGWATVADVLTFYQERIANEGYLRTATERRSILELARLVGYTLRPGVAASVYLAYTLDKTQTTPTLIPAGARSQSVPNPGEVAQSFETSEALEARAAWNTLTPRLSRPPLITLDNAQRIETIYLEGTALNLKPNDRLLFVFGAAPGEQVMRRVKEAKPQFDHNRTEVTLQPVPVLVSAAVLLLRAGLRALDEPVQLPADAPNPKAQQLAFLESALKTLLENWALDNYPRLDAAYFSLDRLYHRPQAQVGLRFFSMPPQAEGPVPSPVAWQDPSLTQAVGAALDAAIGLMKDPAFTGQLACLANDVVRQARPANANERVRLKNFLAEMGGQILERINQIVAEVATPGPFASQFEQLQNSFQALLRTAELHDSLGGLLTDLYEASSTSGSGGEGKQSELHQVLGTLRDGLQRLGRGHPVPCQPAPGTTSVNKLATPLTRLPSIPPVNATRLPRALQTAFSARADGAPQVLVGFAPRLRDGFYTAWANAAVYHPQPQLQSVHVFRMEAAPFGYNAPVKMALTKNSDATSPFPYISQPDGDWSIEQSDEQSDRLFLDAAYNTILPESYVVIHTETIGTRPPTRLAACVTEVLIRPRTAYGLSGKTTQLALSRAWLDPVHDPLDKMRKTTVYAQSEPVHLAAGPYTADVQGQHIELNELYAGLTSGRWLIITGERTDIPGTTGVSGTELVMLSAVDQHYDGTLPGDKTVTTLTLATALAYTYKRDTVTLYGNVVKATHGETRAELLGNGDGSRAFQAFDLKQPPLTYVSAPTPAGAESTLHVFVNDLEWHEVSALAHLGPTDHTFITRTTDEGKTTVIFGNGQQGARLPTGAANVRAEYRNGLGQTGNVQARQISLLQTRPLGVKEVINPLRASGGADKETRDQARRNIPLQVMALDRLVSAQDYADFARTFAGIAKASAQRLSVGPRELVHLTIAGGDDAPIDPSSDLYRNLLKALHDYGDPDLPLQVEARELLLLVLSAKVYLKADYVWEVVVANVRATLLDAFSFDQRELGQAAILGEAIATMQAVPGVAYVDVDIFGGIPEKKAEGTLPKRRLLTPREITQAVQKMVSPSGNDPPQPQEYIPVTLAGYTQGTWHPAQLAFLSPLVPDTLILNRG